MSVSRLFEIVYLLLDKKQMTAGELAERFEVSVRTIYRDVDALSSAGIPIYASTGRNGGISLLDHYILDRAAFSQEEQGRLLTALQSLPGVDQPENRAVLAKLSGLFGRREPDWLQVDFSPWGASQTGGRRFEELRGAILERKGIRFAYASSYGGETRRRVLPARLVFKGRAWYLQGYCLDREAYRTFRVSRMMELEVTGEYFDRTLDPPDIESDNSPPKSCVSLHLRVSSWMAYRICDDFDPSSILREPDGSLLVEARFPEDDWLYGYLLSLGTGVEVLSPLSVRRRLGQLARQIAQNCENVDTGCQGLSDIMGASQTEEDITMEQKFCQSCGMPLNDPSLCGTESGGTPSEHYCKYCYQDGAFTGDMTMEQMVDFCVPIMVKEHPELTEQEVKAQMMKFFPSLLRWKKG